MHNRLISLESVVTEQNALIKVLTQKNDLVGQSPLNENITPNTGRPRRAAQVQALSAITAGARNKIGVQKPKVPPSQSFAGRVRVPNGNKTKHLRPPRIVTMTYPPELREDPRLAPRKQSRTGDSLTGSSKPPILRPRQQHVKQQIHGLYLYRH
ncbi:hypothetical protein O0L34_g3747 [Tuta absoluta]|nr:hypothetical protein O0L34_g3747 [Tuta absoluta]